MKHPWFTIVVGVCFALTGTSAGQSSPSKQDYIQDKIFIAAVLAGGAAEKAGLLKGDEILAANGQPFTPVASLRVPPGHSVQFKINPESGSATMQMVYLGLTFALFGVIFLVLLGYFSGGIGSWLSGKQSWADKIRWFTGSILITLGLRLAFLDRQ